MGFGGKSFGAIPFGSTSVLVVIEAPTAIDSITHIVEVSEVTHNVTETVVTRQIITHSVSHVVGSSSTT